MASVPPSPFFRASLKRQAAPHAPVRARRVRRRVYGPANRVLKWPRYFADQPYRKFAKLRYVIHENLAGPTVGAINVKQYRANSLYDPEYAVGGHQPMGFDQLMAQYNHYTVLKSTFQVEALNSIYYNNVVAIATLSAEAGAVAATFASGGANALREMPIIAKDLVMQIGHYQEGARSTTLYFNTSKFFGKSQSSIIGDARFQGEANTDPPEDAIFSIALYSPTGVAEQDHNFPFKICIDFWAVFTEPKWFTTS